VPHGRVPHGELTAQKWLDSAENKNRSDLKFAVTDRHRYRQTDRVNDKK